MWQQLLGTPEYISLARKEGRARPFWFCILQGAVLFVIGTAVHKILLVIPAIVSLFSAPSDNPDQFNESMAQLLTSPGFSIILLFSTGALIAACLIYWKKINRSSFASIGLGRRGAVPEYLVGAAIGLAMMAATVGFNMIFGAVTFEGVAIKMPTDVLFVALFLLGYLVQGFSEEILCRGFLTAAICRTRSPLFAMLITAAIFTVLHLKNSGLTPFAVVNLFLFSLVASMYAYRRGNIWGVAALHSLWNFAQGNLFGISVSGGKSIISAFKFDLVPGRTWLNGGSFGLEGGLATTFILLIVLAILTAMKPKSETDPRIFV